MQLGELIATRKDKWVYRDGDAIIKVFDENYSRSNILNEAINQSRVEETGLNIPKIRGINVINGKWAIIMDYVEGETLESLIKREPNKREEHLSRFIAIQKEIHAKKSPLLTKFKDKMTSRILQSELSASTRYDLSLRLDAMPKHTHVCHGDYNPSNIVINRNNEAYILDWSHASQGNATADAAKTYLILRMGGENELADEYLTRFAHETNVTDEYVRSWLPIVAAAQLVKISDKEKKSFLMKFVNEEEGYGA